MCKSQSFVLLLASLFSIVYCDGDAGGGDANAVGASPGVAIGMTFFVTASTMLGSCLPLIVLAINKSKVSKMFMAAAFAFASGAIIFGGLFDVLPSSVSYFAGDQNVGSKFASLSAMASFILGIAIFVLLEVLLKYFVPDLDCPCHGARVANGEVCEPNHPTNYGNADLVPPTCDCEAPDGGQEGAAPIAHNHKHVCGHSTVKSISLLAFIAMTIHHIPEGMIFYLTVIQNFQTGAIVGLILLIHVFPEGMSMGFPALEAYPNQKWRCIVYGAIAGLAHPIGALIAFGIMQQAQANGVGFGIISGLTSGFLVTIAVKGLLPYARSIDTKDRLTTIFVFLGMLVIFFSIVLFDIVGFSG